MAHEVFSHQFNNNESWFVHITFGRLNWFAGFKNHFWLTDLTDDWLEMRCFHHFFLEIFLNVLQHQTKSWIRDRALKCNKHLKTKNILSQPCHIYPFLWKTPTLTEQKRSFQGQKSSKNPNKKLCRRFLDFWFVEDIFDIKSWPSKIHKKRARLPFIKWQNSSSLQMKSFI